jgi:hypothetical protein
MNIQLEVTKEYEDGSADAVVHFDKEGLAILVEAGILSILKQYIEKQKENK